MLSPLHEKRLEYKLIVPDLLKDLNNGYLRAVSTKSPPNALKSIFPNTFDQSTFELDIGECTKRGEVKIGVVFSGGQAPGGHNVIAGLFDSGAKLIGFLGGPSGVIENRFIEVQEIDPYRNQGGFDLLGSGRTKIETEEQLLSVMKTVNSHKLDGLVIIGGDDSNTNAAILAEYFLANNCTTKIVGVPKTIDGDLRSEDIEISFGFDSACRTYSEIIGNIARDALSSKKYYHFIKLMGRSASHIALECALSTQPNLTLITEEKRSLTEIIDEIVQLIEKRKAIGKEYGVILIPEGLIEFVPELNELCKELNIEKDSHGNLEVSKIQTEKIIIDLVRKKSKLKFNAQEHFLGYEGRACLPSNFDANYCYSLGLFASLIIHEELTGMICSAQKLKNHPSQWSFKAIPIVQLMHLETRLGKEKPVIAKTLVDLKSSSYLKFSHKRSLWELDDLYRYPGPIQFFGPPEITDLTPSILE